MPIHTIYKKIRKILRPLKLKTRFLMTNALYGTKRLVNPPALPHNKDNKKLIHLGCGYQNDSRYINVDGLPFPHVHYLSRVEKLPMFADNFADLVYACHVLEHLSHQKLVEILQEWGRVLKKGGVLRLSVPDFDKIIHIYEKENHDIYRIIPPLMGTHESGDFDFHRAVFNKSYLTDILLKAGFSSVREWDPETAPYYSFKDWAGPRKVHGIYSIGLNLEGVK